MIIAALKDEVREIKARMSLDCVIHFKPVTLYRGRLFNKNVDLLVTGIGADRMEKGLKEALALAAPQALLLVGYAGGASPLAAQGSLILAKEIVDAKSGEHFKSDVEFLDKASRLSKENQFNYKIGNIVTVDRVISNPHEKADLGATYSAIALEMEGAAVAREAGRREIPFLVAKAIFDPLEMTLPAFQDCVGPVGEIKPTKLMERVFKNPKEMMQLPKMQYLASQARNTITKFVEAWIQSQ